MFSRLTEGVRGFRAAWARAPEDSDAGEVAHEGQLRDSEELHRIVSELGYEFSFRARVKGDEMDFYTPDPKTLERLLGPGVGAGLDWSGIIDPRDAGKVEESIQVLLRDGICRTEFRTRAGADDVRWREMVERCTRDPESGERTIYGAVRDVTVAREADVHLKESEGRLRAILDSEPECVMTVDEEHRLLHMNPAGLRMIEADSFDEVSKADLLKIVEPEYREVFRDLNRRAFAGETVTAEFQIRGLKGTRRWMETHAVPLRNATGKVIAQLSITRDMGEQRRIQEGLLRAQRREALGVMAGGIAHDFNNMLYVILGRAELALRRPGIGDDVKRDLTELESAARRAAAITQQILTFSRGPTGEEQSVDLSGVVADAVQLLRATVPATRSRAVLHDEGGRGGQRPRAGRRRRHRPKSAGRGFGSQRAGQRDDGGGPVARASR
ncbi:MAG: PAS domain S-box protein [Candidatus Binatia bacterium]|nr:PAS domain S-box protein [Candidatus Binatia bacterium]